MRRFRLLVLLVALATLAAGCRTSDEPASVDDAAISAAADLRSQVIKLFREHVYLAAFMTEGIATKRTKEFMAAASAFDDNAVAIALVLREQYGENAHRDFLALWRLYSTAVSGYAARLVNRRPAAPLVKRLDEVPTRTALLLSSITPLLNPVRARAQMADVISAVKSFVSLQSKRDFAKADSTVRTAGARAGLLGAELANALIEDRPAIHQGDPNAPAAVFRYGLGAILAENVYLLSLATQDSIGRRSAEFKAATAALKVSTGQLSAHLVTVYGEPFRKSFTPLWERFGNLVLAYAAAGKVKAKKDKAAADLTQHTKDLSTFLVGANEEVVDAELERTLTAYVAAHIAIVDRQVSGDHSSAGIAIREAVRSSEGIEVLLTRATVRKFPAKFTSGAGSSRTPAG